MPMPLFMKPAGFGLIETIYGFDFYVEDWVTFAMSGVEIEVNGVIFYVE